MSAVRHLETTPEVAAEVQTVTPELACKWLETNEGNRRVREQLVSRLARDMRAGRWQVTGEGIKFDQDGRLIDGQHRLWAVVQSGATIDILVVHNLDRDTRLVMDTGGKRVGADALAMAEILTDLFTLRRQGNIFVLKPREFGFDGKTLIHPSQLAPCNEIFAPSAEEVDFARTIVEAFDLPENRGKGVIRVGGRMVELLHAEMARHTVAVAEAIAARRDSAS